MENKLPDPHKALMALAKRMLAGSTTYGAGIGQTHHTYLDLGPKIVDAEGAQFEYKTAAAASATGRTVVETADLNGRAFITSVREHFKPRLGKNPNPAWEPLGFPDDSLAVPESQDDRLEMIQSMNTWLLANPTFQVDTAEFKITATLAKATYDALDGSRIALGDLQEIEGRKEGERDSRVKELRAEMRGMLRELKDLMGPLDSRWLWFGLNQPGAVSGASRVETLVLTSISQGFLAAWAHAAFAHLYHVEIKIAGVDTEFRRVKTTSDTTCNVPDLPPAATVEVRVLAVNDSGTEAQPSDVKTVVTGI
jgi:hypothetical protein